MCSVNNRNNKLYLYSNDQKVKSAAQSKVIAKMNEMLIG